MDTASSIVIVIPVMTLIALFTGIALPFIAASRSGRTHLACAGCRSDRSRRGPDCVSNARATVVGVSLALIGVMAAA